MSLITKLHFFTHTKGKGLTTKESDESRLSERYEISFFLFRLDEDLS